MKQHKPPLPPTIPTFADGRNLIDPILGRLYAAFKASTVEARGYMLRKLEKDESFFSHHTRYLAKVALRADGVDAEDESELEQTANTGICISNPQFIMRVLRDTDNGAIPASDSDRRKRFLAQQSEQMPLDLKATKEQEREEAGQERAPVNFVLLWGTDAQRLFTGFWFICPNGEKAHHFKKWLPVPNIDERTLPPVPPQGDMPPDLGFTRKDDVSDDKTKKTPSPKTGTDLK